MADTPDSYVDAFLEEATGLTFGERAFVRALTENRRPGWRNDLERDPTPAANRAKWALRAVATSEPSYYADEGTHFSHELAREQAAEALAAWRLTRA